MNGLVLGPDPCVELEDNGPYLGRYRIVPYDPAREWMTVQVADGSCVWQSYRLLRLS